MKLILQATRLEHFGHCTLDWILRVIPGGMVNAIKRYVNEPQHPISLLQHFQLCKLECFSKLLQHGTQISKGKIQLKEEKFKVAYIMHTSNAA